jgi:hypothetical protein
LGEGEARLDGAAGGAFEAADAAGNVDGLIHFHTHRAAAAAEVAFHALPRIEPEMKQAEPVEKRKQPAKRTEYPAPRAMDEKRGAKERQQNACLQSTHHPAVAGEQALHGVRDAGFERAGRTEATNGNYLSLEWDASVTQKHGEKYHEPGQNHVTNVAGPSREADFPGCDFGEHVLEETEGTGPTTDD